MDKHAFFREMNNRGLALTFDDVLLRTAYTEILPSQVSVTTWFSRRIRLNIPVSSAAMDTVTGQRLAIRLAQEGGIGIVHRRQSIERQARMVNRVKLFLNGLVERPITVRPDDTIEQIQRRRAGEGWKFDTFPVTRKAEDATGEGEELVGIITGSHFKFCVDPNLTASQIMTPRANLVTASVGTTLQKAYEIMHRRQKGVLPLVDGHRLVGMYVWKDLKRIRSNRSRHNVDERKQLIVGAAIGVGDEALERAAALAAVGANVLVIDTAHANSEGVLKTLERIRRDRAFDHIDVVAGNVSEGDAAKRLADAGADAVKVGQGCGSPCTTRVVARVGCPQVTAIYNCANAIAGSGIPIIADGGIRNSGDITVALGAGAYCVMLGGALAGTREAPGKVVLYRGMQMKDYRGMGSLGALESHEGARDRYQQADVGKDRLVPEGVEGLVPYKGALADVLHQYVGGLRASMGYLGVASVDQLREEARFYQVTFAGMVESHPHDMIITKEPPNYKVDSR